MKWKSAFLLPILTILLSSLVATAAVAQAPDVCPDRSLFLNVSTDRAERVEVALRLALGNLGMAQQTSTKMDVAIFLSDEAAMYSVRPECFRHIQRDGWFFPYSPKLKDLAAIQGSDGAPCPMSPGDELSLKSLVACGVKVYGCHLCIAREISHRCGELLNPDGSVNPTVWDNAVLDGVIRIDQMGSPAQMEFFEAPYSNRLDGCTGIDSATLSF